MHPQSRSRALATSAASPWVRDTGRSISVPVMHDQVTAVSGGILRMAARPPRVRNNFV